MAEGVFKFRPTEPETLAIMLMAWATEEEDPVDTFSRLFSAALMAGAFINLTAESFQKIVNECLPRAHQAMAAHPEIFGQAMRPQ